MRLHMPHFHRPHFHPHFHMRDGTSWIIGAAIIFALVAAVIAVMVALGTMPMYGVPSMPPVLFPAL